MPFASCFRYEGQLDAERRPHGEGKIFVGEAVVYYGEFVHGSMTGVGFRRYQSGATYNGEFKDGLCEGKGVWMSADKRVILEGTFSNDCLEGSSCKETIGHVTCTGSFQGGKRHGFIVDNTMGKTTKWVHGYEAAIH
eukprot:m.6652 g.6652  ORF g.6652 m.6652 type:complete len:137 (-) comp2628_c0_seq1:1887-2297(-)